MPRNKKSEEEEKNEVKAPNPSKALTTVNKLMSQLSNSIYSTDVTSDVTDELNDRFNNIMETEVNRITGNRSNDYSSFIGKLYAGDMKQGKSLQDIAGTFDIGDSDGAVNPAEFISEQYRNKFLKQADAHQIASQLIELEEAVDTMVDAIFSPDVTTGEINRSITFQNATVSDVEKEYKPIVIKMENKTHMLEKMKHIGHETLIYGNFFGYTIPYNDIFKNFANRYKRSRSHGFNRFFESGDGTPPSVYDPKITSLAYMESSEDGDPIIDTKFINEVVGHIKSDSNFDTIDDHLTGEKLEKDVTTLLDQRITISTSPIPLPILEDGVEAYHEIGERYITESGNFFESVDYFEAKEMKRKGSSSKQTTSTDFLKKYTGTATAGEANGFYDDSNSSLDKEFNSEIKDCYNKLVPPTRMFPIKIMGQTLFYMYIETDDATPLSTILSYSAQIRQRDPNNKINRMVDDIAGRIVSRFDETFIRENKEFRKIIVAALEYYDLSNTMIHFQVVPKQYVTEFKVNKDVNGEGHSMLERSMFYAKFYLMIFVFKVFTILTKSNDTTINYFRTSGIDKDVYNKAQNIMRQKRNRRISLNDMFSYTNALSKIGAGSEITMPMARNGEKPVESEILQGQDVDLASPLTDKLRENYILGSGVPSAIMNYLNEADFAKSVETANTKMAGRVSTNQIDLNAGFTEYYQKNLRFSTDIPEEVIQSLRIILPPPKGNSNVATQELMNNYETLEKFLISIYIGEEGGEESMELTKAFRKELAKLHLPAVNFGEIDEMFKKAQRAAAGDELVKKSEDIDMNL